MLSLQRRKKKKKPQGGGGKSILNIPSCRSSSSSHDHLRRDCLKKTRLRKNRALTESKKRAEGKNGEVENNPGKGVAGIKIGTTKKKYEESNGLGKISKTLQF